MEPKKNPKYDIHLKRGVLLNVGLIVSLIIVITAFKWKVAVKPIIENGIVELSSDGLFIEDPRITDFRSNDPPKPQPVKPVIHFPTEFTESVDPSNDSQPTVGPDQSEELTPISFGVIDIPKEVIKPDTFRVVERMPEPVGGWSAFYKTLGKNIKYPRQAERARANGRVFVEFTVNDKGELSHFKIIKGVGYGCDEEAKRVISLTKWNPGKQRGVPVNVKMVQPITFALEH
jgi:periplasmic protein TonB